MPRPSIPDDGPDPAPCSGARRLLAGAIGVALMMALLIAADLSLRLPGQDEEARNWMRVLTLSAPALWPAGTPPRHPETLHPGVTPRFAAGLENAP